jgi:2-keto-4-pentenoate hydratase/2-oxohepta-3-ene-1,7-dioic acid hydratase in catechol pathway
VAHASALTNVADLGISMEFNGENRQDSRTSRMIFPIPEIIDHLSRGLTSEPSFLVL